VVGLVNVHGNVWRWRVHPPSRGHDVARVRRRKLPGPVRDASVQLAGVPGQLPSLGVGPVVDVLRVVRRRSTKPHARGDSRLGAWWFHVPVALAVASVQFSQLPGGLRRWFVVVVVDVLALVRRWRANRDTVCQGGRGLWRQGLPVLARGAGVQHARLPD